MFICYSKSGVIKGIVSSTFSKVKYDLANGVRVKYDYIVSEKGEIYSSMICLRVESVITPLFLKKLISLFSKKR